MDYREKIRKAIECPRFGNERYGEWGALSLNKRILIKRLLDELDSADNCFKRFYKENEELKKQLEYLRSGEYYNQIRFENKMLQDIVDNGEVSEIDKAFIDMTHRNTELLEENQKLKERIDYLERSNNRREELILELREELIPSKASNNK